MFGWEVIIGGVNVLADGHAPAVSLISLTRNYDDPAELLLRVHGDWRKSPWACDTPVAVRRDAAGIVFDGLIYLPSPILGTRAYPGVDLIAHDRSHALRFETCRNADGFPEILLDPGPLGSVIAAFFDIPSIAEKISAKGIGLAPTFAFGAESSTCLPVSISGETIDEAIRKIAAAAPGVRVFLAPPAEIGEPPAYRFVRIGAADAFELALDVERVSQLAITPSLDGRAGAVVVLGGKTLGEADAAEVETEPLIPGWNPARESDWTLDDAVRRSAETGEYLDAEAAAVYRRFTWSREIADESMIVRALVEIVPNAENPELSAWASRAIESINLAEKTLWLKSPAIAVALRNNRMALRYYLHRGRSVALPAKLVLQNSGTATTPIYIDEIRVPENGYSGRAVAMAPVRCANEVIITVPAGVDRAAYAAQMHAALSEPVIQGDLPINGELPVELWGLGRRINIITTSHGDSGLEDLLAPVLGVRQEFSPAAQSVIQFNRDDTQLLAGGAA